MTAALLCAAAALLSWPVPPVRRLAPPPGSALGSLRRAVRPTALVAGPAAAVLGLLVSTPLVAGLAGCCAALSARAWQRRRREERQEARLLVVTETLGSLARELRSGRSLAEASRTAIGECPDPDIARTLARALAGTVAAEQEPGPLGTALRRIAAAVRLSARTGCPLGAVLSAIEDDLRDRYRHRVDLRSATAGSRASAVLLAGLPLLGLAMGSGVGADPWAVLTTTAAGQVLLVVGAALEVAGVAWVARLLRAAVP